MPINQLRNSDLDRSWQYGGYVAELPPLKLRLEVPKLLCLTAREMTGTTDGGDHEVMYR